MGLGERYLLEPVCVEARNGKNEDESLVLSCVINIRERITSLLVLDAKGSRGWQGNLVIGINSVDNTKLPCYTLPPMQHHNFFRNLPPLFRELAG